MSELAKKFRKERLKMTDKKYETATYGDVSIGFGQQAAVVVVDFQLGFTDPQYTLGGSAHIHSAVRKTSNLLSVARKEAIPIASCKVGWGSKNDMGYWKIGCLYEDWFYGDPQTEMDPRVYEPSYDFNFWKHSPSIFFGTPLVNFLTKQKVDTVIIAGCTTSGCVRASINDAFSYGYRVVVPHDCCGDMDEGPHNDNLRDVGRRYADVMDSEAVVAEIQKK